MSISADQSERLANYFVRYLVEHPRYRDSRHIRRVATWIGFIVKAIEREASRAARNRERQVVFWSRRRKFKVRFNHKVGARGGLEIIEVLPRRGSPEGGVLATITSLDGAEELYLSFGERLAEFGKAASASA
jgi:hypothetical protein